MRKILSLSILVVFIFSCVFTVPTSTVYAANTVYYISQSAGNDNNNGTSMSTPWKTLAKVGSMSYGPGDQILLKCGDTWNEQLTLNNLVGGTNVITIGSYGTGNKPSILRNSLQADKCIKIIDAANIRITNLEIGNAGLGIIVHNENILGGNIKIDNCYFHDITGIHHLNPIPSENQFSMSAAVTVGAANPEGMVGVSIDNCTTYRATSLTNNWGRTQNLYITNCTTSYNGYGGASICYVDGGYIDNCHFLNGGTTDFPVGAAGLYIGDSTNYIVRNTEIAYQTRYGSNPDGCGADFEAEVYNSSLQNVYIHDNAGVGVMFFDNGRSRYNDHCDITNSIISNNSANPNVWTKHAILFSTPSNDNYGVISGNSYYLRSGEAFINSYDSSVTVTDNTQLSSPPSVPTFSTVTPPTLPTITPITCTIYQAEIASRNNVNINTNNAGYLGTGFTDSWNTVGDSLTFTIDGNGGGTKQLAIRFANGTGNWRTLSLYVNGTKAKQITLANTGGWSSWSDCLENVSLNSGSNTIKIQYDSADIGEVNIDCIKLSNPIYYKLINLWSGKAAHNTGEAYNGNSSAVAQCLAAVASGDTNDQLWQKLRVGTNGYYKLINKATGKRIHNTGEAYNGNLSSDAQWAAVVAEANDDAQLWRTVDVGNGYFKLICKNTGKCLHNTAEAYNGNPQNNNVAVVWDTGANEQKWQFVRQN
ncbi:MAG TPA: RICIN domain-containing protein [Ruminiclostridium sp.]